METKNFGSIVINVNGGFMFFVFSVKIMPKIFLCGRNVSVNFVLYFQSFLYGFGFKSMCFFLIFTMW